MPAIDRLSKPDSRLLLLGSIVDVSQYRTNLVDQGGWWNEAASSRTDWSIPWSVQVDIEIVAGNTGTIIDRVGLWRIDVAAGVIRFFVNGVQVAGHTFADGMHILGLSLWTTPVGARAESTIYNFATAAWDIQHFDLPGPPPSPGATELAVMANAGGASQWTGDDPNTVRVGRRAHASTETREDFVLEQVPPPSTFGESKTQALPVETVGDQGHFTGPAYVSAGDATIANRRRLRSPLGAERAPNYGYEFQEPAPILEWVQNAKGPGNYQWHLGHIYYRPIPPGVQWVTVRAFLRQRVASGGPALPVHWRVWSCNALPNLEQVVNGPDWQPLTCFYTPLQDTNTDHMLAGQLGEWVDFGRLKVSEDGYGLSYFLIGANFDDADDQQRGAVLDLTIDPLPTPFGDEQEAAP